MRVTILQKGLLIIAVPLLCQIGFSAAYSYLLSEARQTLVREAQWQDVCDAGQNVQTDLQRTMSLSILTCVVGGPELRQGQLRMVKRLMSSIKRLREALHAPSVRAIANVMAAGEHRPLAPGGVGGMMMMIGRNRIGADMTIAEALSEIGQPVDLLVERWSQSQTGKQVTEVLQKASLENSEQQRRFDENSQAIQTLVQSVLLVNIVLGAALSMYFFKDITRRVEHVRINTLLLSRRKLPVPPIAGNDEIAELDVAVHRTADEILRLESFKKQMVGVVSHELKAPLTSVQGIVSLLSQKAFGEVSDGVVERARKIENNLARLIRLVNDLLALERMESEGFHFEPREVAISELTDRSIAAVESLAAGRHVTLVWNGDDRKITADPERMVQVLINLLSNAIKFADENSTVTISSICRDDQICLSVLNTGRPIPPDYREKIFERFSQIEAADAKKGGSGLGLAIAKSIVEQHHGSIDLESEGGQTAFIVSLPVKNAPAAGSAPLLARQRGSGHLKLWQKGLLLVGLPILINITFLVGFKQMWISVEKSLHKVRDAGKLTTDTLLLSDSISRTVWLSLFVAGRRTEVKGAQEQALREFQERRKPIEQAAGIGQRQDLQSFLQAAAEIVETAKAVSRTEHLTVAKLGAYHLFEGLTKSSMSASRISDGEHQAMNAAAIQQKVSLDRLQLLLWAAPAVNALISLLLLAFFSRSVSNRIGNVATNVGRLSKRQALAPPETGSDEISDLDIYFHNVASKIMRLEEFKEQMISIASHELRSPLTSVAVTLQMLNEGTFGPLPEKANQRLKVAEEETNRLIRMINNLLDFEKLQAGKIELHRVPSEVSSAVRAAEKSVRYLADNAGITLECDLPDDMSINWDEDRIVQVLVNLLSNAIKFSSKQTTVKLSVAESDEEIVLAVTDQGRGIPAAKQAKLFGRFQQVEADDYRLGGSGLGLAISKWIIELHDGTIELHSKEGVGTTFICHFPKAAAAERGVSQAVAQHSAAEGQTIVDRG